MDKIKIPINPDLASALSKIERDHLRLINATSGPLNRSIEAWKQHSYPFYTTQDVFNQMKFSAKDIYSSFEQFQNPLLSGDFGSARIATIVNQSGIYDHLSAYTANWKENFNTLLKSDFRIAVVSQEIAKQLDDYSTKDEFYESSDTSSQFISGVAVQKNNKDEQTNEINELKLLIIELSEKFSDFKEDSSNKNLDANQSNEKNKNSAWKIIAGLIGAFFFVCEFIEHSETAYHLILWLQQTIDVLLNHVSSK